MKPPKPLLTVHQALDCIRQHASALVEESCPLVEVLGRVLARDAVSDIDSPPHRKAMMDGYAVVSGDPAPQRQVLEEVIAGAVPTQVVRPGSVTRIMTGAPMPDGADAVVPVEQSEAIDSTTVRLPLPGPPTGKHVAPQGEAMTVGQTVLVAGTRITPADVALLAETGHASVPVFPRPTVAVLATGDELVDASTKPTAGQIRNSNGPMLLSLAQDANASPVDLGVARDDVGSIREAILAGRTSNVLLLSGGVSAGTRDLTPGVLQELGVQQVFHKVAVKPGKPLWFGTWPGEAGRSTLVFGLPGNPVSGYVCFQLFVRPLLEAMQGRPFAGLPRVTAQLSQEVHHRGDREAYLPANLTPAEDGIWRVAPVAWRGSADLAGLSGANALVKLPLGGGNLSPESLVETLLLGPVSG